MFGSSLKGLRKTAAGSVALTMISSSFLSALPAFSPMAFAAELCNGQAATVVGLTGTSGDDVIIGTDGNDTISGGGGVDTICAKGGNDTVTSGSGSDWIDGGEGNNTINAGSGNNTITTGSGDDNITSTSGNDTINAGEGVNTINAGSGTNNITTGSGNDNITTTSGSDTINAGDGDNIVDADSGNNNITTGSGNDTITSTSGDDTINAGNGHNTVIAGSGNNTITTGSGDDTVVTTSGQDSVNAGAGNDIVVTGSSNDSIDGGADTDICHGEGGTNTIVNCEGASTSSNSALIAIKKNSIPDNSGTFEFIGSGVIGNFSVNGDDMHAFHNSDPGSGSSGTTYTVTESAEADWTLTDIVCTSYDGSADSGTSDVGSTATIKLNRGDVIVCTFSNTQTSSSSSSSVSSESSSSSSESSSSSSSVSSESSSSSSSEVSSSSSSSSETSSSVSSESSSSSSEEVQIEICHNGATTSVAASALGGHLGHGDTEGPCSSSSSSSESSSSVSSESSSSSSESTSSSSESSSSTVTVTIVKYVNGALATAEGTSSTAFPMHSIWSNTEPLFGAGEGNYSLGPTGFNNPNAYYATTSDMPSGANYSTYETSENCTESNPYQLAGYTTGNTLEDAEENEPSQTVPNLTEITTNKYIIVWNTSCGSSSSSTSSSSSFSSEGSSSSSSSEETFSAFNGNGVPDQGEDGQSGARRGHTTNRLGPILTLLRGLHNGTTAPGAFGGSADVPLSTAELQLICNVQKTLPQTMNAGLITWAAEQLAELMDRPVEMLEDVLRTDVCAMLEPEAKAVTASADAIEIPLDAKGIPVSNNDLWNKCIRDERIYLEDVRGNVQPVEQVGRTRLRNLPSDCGSYHTGNNWLFPDLNIHFTWDKSKKTASFPKGYVGVKQQSVASN